jgi:hypothetical protein
VKEANMPDYKQGDIIRYNAFGGCGRTVLVEEKDDDIKNGRPGFHGVMVDSNLKPLPEKDGMGVWGYDSQIVRVVKRG